MILKNKRKKRRRAPKKDISDFHRKRLENPFASKRRAPGKKILKESFKKIPLKLKVAIPFALIIGGGIIWFIFFCPVWTMDKVKVEGAHRINPEEIENMAHAQVSEAKGGLFPADNLILFENKELSSRIKDNFRIEKAQVEKEWPSTLKIEIEEKSISYIWKEGEKYYRVSRDGNIIKTIDKEKENEDEDGEKKEKEEMSEKPLIEDKTEGRVVDGRITAPASDIDFIFDLFEEFDKNENGITPEKFILSPKPRTIEVITEEGPAIYFDKEADHRKQLRRLLAIKKEKLEDSFFEKEYIDLRYGDRVFYQ